MSGEWFVTISEGDSVEEAFRKAVKDAQYWHGHRGYTGTIAEKDSYNVIFEPRLNFDNMTDREIMDHFWGEQWLDNDKVSQKWGPCGAVKIRPNRWIFFGCASS